MKWFDIKNKNYWRVNGDQDYSIQEVSKITGITVRSLRNYLKTYENLLNPRRGYYNSLIFSAEDVQAFVMIKTLITGENSNDQGLINESEVFLICVYK